MSKYERILLSYGYDKEDLKDMTAEEIKREALEIADTSSMHPNETWDEFIEHEDM